MVKKLLILASVVLTITACEPEFVQKEGYQQLNTELSGSPQVVEFFGYFCPHCNDLEPYVEKWKRTKSSKIEFSRVPVDFGNPTGRPATRAFFVAKNLNVIDKLHPLFFALYHKQGQSIRTKEQMTPFFINAGVSKADFDKAWDSEEVENEIQNAYQLTKKYKIDSVPTFIVNGKYKTSVTMAGGQEELTRLLTKLARLRSDDTAEK